VAFLMATYPPQYGNVTIGNAGAGSSTISISDLKELQSEGNMPKRSGRRKKSASNTVSLDI
jgi:hypothetical protein